MLHKADGCLIFYDLHRSLDYAKLSLKQLLPVDCQEGLIRYAARTSSGIGTSQFIDIRR